MEPILDVKDLSVSYQKSEQEVLKGINLTIGVGEVVGLLGESGCGKSTLARCIAGLKKDYKGSITHYSKMPQMVFQDSYSVLNPAKKVGWILEEPLRIQGGYTAQERQKKVVQMLKTVGLEERIGEHYPSQLSGGQRQRVCIGAALMLNPQLLLADEAVSALDVTMQAQIVRLFRRLHEERELSILFITHDLRILYQLAHKVAVMKDGEIIEYGTPEEVYRFPKTKYMKQLLEAADIVF